MEEKYKIQTVWVEEYERQILCSPFYITYFLAHNVKQKLNFFHPFAESASGLVEGRYGHANSKLIYGTFTTPTNAIAGSAVCAFSLQVSARCSATSHGQRVLKKNGHFLLGFVNTNTFRLRIMLQSCHSSLIYCVKNKCTSAHNCGTLFGARHALYEVCEPILLCNCKWNKWCEILIIKNRQATYHLPRRRSLTILMLIGVSDEKKYPVIRVWLQIRRAIELLRLIWTISVASNTFAIICACFTLYTYFLLAFAMYDPTPMIRIPFWYGLSQFWNYSLGQHNGASNWVSSNIRSKWIYIYSL